VEFRATADARGALSASMTGSLAIASGNRARVEFSGALRGARATARLVADGRRMAVGPSGAASQADAPAALNEGLVLGMVRMGVLHNVVVLAGGRPPDGTDGKARDLVTYNDAALRTPETVEGVETQPVAFRIAMKGKPVGQAVLWLDAKTGLPVKRTQTVFFPKAQGGDMTVTERYEGFRLGGDVDPSRFAVDRPSK
jgi:hypothetical protein